MYYVLFQLWEAHKKDLLTTEVIEGKEEDAYLGQDMNAASVTVFQGQLWRVCQAKTNLAYS